MAAPVFVEAAVLEREPATRFVEAARDHAPVLAGDVRLPENLERVGIANAACLIAVTDEDLANITACLHARRLTPAFVPSRVSSTTLRPSESVRHSASMPRSARHASPPMHSSRPPSTTRPRRSFHVDDRPYLALRFECRRSIGFDEIERWRSDGLRVLAVRRGEGDVHPPSDLRSGLDERDSVIVAGPEWVVVAMAN